ncbi:hypothetical protein [Actinoplanes sp. DH11]|uniref:hypothetical protein n=1 Tax=Actinoplanes sp. DH11 TaxID=2857011 RepID=UPI001E307E2C|nr:hypothetical protein [Actinoplanes sp. DH11]
MSRKTTARNRAFGLLGLVIVVLIYAGTELAQTHYRSGFGALLLVVGFVLWLVMTKVRSECGVLRQDYKGYCTRPITGLFFGCHQHTWQRPLALIGFGQKARSARSAPQEPAPPFAAPVAPVTEPPTDEIHEGKRNRILFYAAVISTTMGTLSAFTDVLGLFKGD